MNLFEDIDTQTTLSSNTLQLRQYQKDILENARELYDKGTHRQLLAAATGLGKTVIFSSLPEFFPDLIQHKMLVLVHRRELAYQAAEKLRTICSGYTVGIDMADEKSHNADIIVASVQTLGHAKSRRIEALKDRVGIVVVDEAHHVSINSQYDKILNYLGLGSKIQETLPDGTKRLLLGVTATPNRHDKKGLHHFFDDVTGNYNLLWGIKNGYLCDVNAVRISTGCDINNVKMSGKDFSASDLERLINIPKRNDLIAKAIKDHLRSGRGEKVIAFCAGVAQAHDLAETFVKHNVKAAAIDAKTKKPERDRLLEAFRKGEFHVLTNCNIATEGFDVPSVDTIAMARPTESAMLYTQSIGRATRPVCPLPDSSAEERIKAIAESDKKTFTIFDFTDNTKTHFHKVITAPKLFGLSNKFTTKKTLFRASQIVEEAKSKHPGTDLEDLEDLEDIKYRTEKLTVWSIPKTPDELTNLTSLNWKKFGDGYRISFNTVCPETNYRRDFSVRISADHTGRYSVTFIKGKADNGIKEVIENSKQVYTSLEAVFKRCDTFIYQNYSDAITLLDRSKAWLKKAATPNQIYYLQKLGIEIPSGHKLRRGDARDLIDAAKNKQAKK